MPRFVKVFISFLLLFMGIWFVGFMHFTDNIFTLVTNDTSNEKFYVDEMFNQHKEDFVAFQKYDAPVSNDVKLIAYYLPQFHPFKENDEWHGKGFTEWTKVTAAKPLYEGHYQPKLPFDVGFYDLTHDDVMYRQIELAKNYGISGFSFYYYWFSGKKLMEKPVYNYLKNKELNFPFCLFWANENWSKRWDGGNQETLMAWNLTEDDFEPLVQDLLPFFQDDRYIKINGRPLFIIYRPQMVEQELFVKFVSYLKTSFKEKGLNEPYLVGAKAAIFNGNPYEWGLDALMEFNINIAAEPLPNLKYLPSKKIKTDTSYSRFDWADYIYGGNIKKEYSYKTFRTVFPAWDNSARKAYTGAYIFDYSTPDVYGYWLDYAIADTREKFTGDERIVFVNAWNEWGEGAYLEPDQRFGYAYLDMTRRVLDGKYIPKLRKQAPHIGISVLTGGRNRLATGLRLLHESQGDRLLISGVMDEVSLEDIAAREDVSIYDGDDKVIDLGYKARTTIGNAEEIKEWVQNNRYQKIFAVTSFYHLPRAKLELKHAMPQTEIEFVAVGSNYILPQWWLHWESFKFLAIEYCKYLAVWLKYLGN